MKSVSVDTEAREELDEAIGWYNERREGLGHELQSEVEAAVTRIRIDPGIGARYRNTSYRFFRVNRFPYIVYYILYRP